jgi:hypothetical protein
MLLFGPGLVTVEVSMSTELLEEAPQQGVRCPRCDTGRLDPATAVKSFVACSRCDHQAAVAYVAEELWLEQQDTRLHARLSWVRDRVVAGDAAVEPASARRVSGGARPALTVQTVLLSGGALLLVLAGVVFAAVAWDRLGAAGQVGVMVAMVAVLSLAAHLIKRSYRSTAEALAAIAAGIAAVALLAAPHLGLGADWMRDRPAAWASVAFTGLALLAVTLAWASRLGAWHVTVIAALVAAALSAALASGGGSSITPLGCAGLAVAAAVILRLHPGRHTIYRHEAPWIGAGVGLLAVAVGLVAYSDLDNSVGWAGAWLVVGVCATAIMLPVRGLAPASRLLARPVTSLSPVLAGLAVGQAMPLLVANWTVSRWTLVPALALCGTALLTGTTIAGRTIARSARSGPMMSWLTLAGPIAAATTWVTSQPVLAATGSVNPGQVSTFFGIVAASVLGMSLLPGRTPLAWVAAPLGTVALWVLFADHGVRTLEAFTGAAAGLLLVAGLLHYRARRPSGSLIVLGPALVMAAIPSALAASAQAGEGVDPLRAVLVIVGGAGLAVAGVTLRVKAALIVGIASATIAGLGQVAALTQIMPRWVALAVAGALLLAAGFSAERLGRAGRHAWRATRQMR